MTTTLPPALPTGGAGRAAVAAVLALLRRQLNQVSDDWSDATSALASHRETLTRLASHGAHAPALVAAEAVKVADAQTATDLWEERWSEAHQTLRETERLLTGYCAAHDLDACPFHGEAGEQMRPGRTYAVTSEREGGSTRTFVGTYSYSADMWHIFADGAKVRRENVTRALDVT